MTGPFASFAGDDIVPSITRAAESAGSPAPRVAAGLPVCVTEDEAGVTDFLAAPFGTVAEQDRTVRALAGRT
ncbi:hypothetical protein [Nonomuraea glycinis]|uniref:hypothetical protein n=1 Tax=Nonomuraea glycinis TaxID=2047744 RepID=UPI0033B8FF80